MLHHYNTADADFPSRSLDGCRKTLSMLNVMEDVLSVAGDEPSLMLTVLRTDKHVAVLTN